jgi:hypothetical protein
VFALLNLIIIVFAFVSFWSVWSATTTYDEGQSGIVIWQEVTKFEYYLRDYQDLTTNEITTYENVANDDYRNDCSLSGRNTAALVGMSLAMAIIGLACALVHLCLPNVDAWDNKTRCLSLSMLITAFFSVFFVMLGVGFWWFGCHNDMIVHADAVSWSSVVARVYTDIKVGTGFALSFINCGIGILSTSWFAAFYRRG